MTLPRIFLADDQVEMLQTVAQILEPDFNLVGTAQDGQRVLQLVPGLFADILVLDICMPLMNGIEVARHLKEDGSAARVVFLTGNDDADFIEAAMSAGALGYVFKPRLATDLIPAIWNAMEGRTFVSPCVQQPAR
jgi:DNA-binding NarL/FixJ family response regulator